MAKIPFVDEEKSVENIEKKMEKLSDKISSFEDKMDKIDKVLGQLIQSLDKQASFDILRAKSEQYAERSEQFERPLRSEMDTSGLNKIRGRHREILAMLVNQGFHTYKEISEKLNISESRARAYIAELKNKYNVPLRHVRDPEGYKVGIDVRFVEETILSK